jgi:hypothetical protein
MKKLKMNKYQLLNVSNTLAELFQFMHSYALTDRVKDVQKICALRAKDENITEMEALSCMMKEVMITRILACLVIFGALGTTIYLATKGMEVLPIIFGIIPTALVIGGIFLRKKIVKRFNSEKISFYTY